MRRLFLVLAKLVGLLQLYWALVNFTQIGFAISMLNQRDSAQVGQLLSGLIGIVLYFCVSLGMAWLLLARTDWIADKLRIPADDPIAALPDDLVLRAGTKLIGVYILAYSIPGLAQVLLEAGAFALWNDPLRTVWTKVSLSALQVVLGLFLALRTSMILNLLAKGEKTQGKQVIIGGLALLALAILLSRGLSQYPRYSSTPVCERAPGSSMNIIDEDANTPAAEDRYTKLHRRE